jgi:glycosyltransferase involved in cell wall biosynthesis
MKVVAYLHPSRCLEPCGGVGRHANSLVRRLAARPGVDLSLLMSRRILGPDGTPPNNFPLADLPRTTLFLDERRFEKVLRLSGWPAVDRFGPAADWYYSPMETPMPVRRGTCAAVTVHDIHPYETSLPWSHTAAHKRTRRSWDLWLPRLLRQADRILTVSHYSKDRMVALLGANPDKVVVVGNGVEDAFFDRGARPADKVDEIVVLGGLRYKKGADHVLDVAQALARRGSPLRVVVIGQNEAPYLARVRDMTNIEIHGMLPDDAVIERMARARAVMLLSLYEGFGMPPLEGMACGTVAVVSNIASLPEVVGDAGLVMDHTRPDEIAATLDQLRTDTTWHDELVARGRTHVQAWRWDRCTDRLVEALS